jgi:hypothetical protein
MYLFVQAFCTLGVGNDKHTTTILGAVIAGNPIKHREHAHGQMLMKTVQDQLDNLPFLDDSSIPKLIGAYY